MCFEVWSATASQIVNTHVHLKRQLACRISMLMHVLKVKSHSRNTEWVLYGCKLRVVSLTLDNPSMTSINENLQPQTEATRCVSSPQIPSIALPNLTR